MTSQSTPVDGVHNLPPQDQMFVALVASGWPYSVAAVKCGWVKEYGWDKMQTITIREAVREAVLQSPDEILRMELGAELTMIRRRLASQDVDSEERAVIDLRLKAIMTHAKFSGVYVDKKQIDRRTIDLSLLSAAALNAQLEPTLEALEPGTKRAIEERLRVVASRSKRKAVAAVTGKVSDKGGEIQ